MELVSILDREKAVWNGLTPFNKTESEKAWDKELQKYGIDFCLYEAIILTKFKGADEIVEAILNTDNDDNYVLSDLVETIEQADTKGLYVFEDCIKGFVLNPNSAADTFVNDVYNMIFKSSLERFELTCDRTLEVLAKEVFDSKATTMNIVVDFKKQYIKNKEEENMVETQTKETLREELKALGIELSNSKFNRTKKEVLINMLEKAKAEMEADVQADAQQQVENHEIMHGEQEVQEQVTHQVVMTDHAFYDKQTVEFTGSEQQCMDYVEVNKIHVVQEGGDANLFSYSVEPVPVVAKAPASNEAKAKTDKLFALIKEKAADNDKKGFGYTISSFMLQAVILEAGTGLKKLKGHTVTAEEEKLTWDIYKWLKTKGFIKPVVYSVKEDEKVRIFMPEYPGKTENTTVKMIPYNKSAGYTAKKATSFLVTIPGAGK